MMPTVRVTHDICASLTGIIVGVLMTSVVWAYDAVAVTNGATITGKVTFEGTPPSAESYELVMSPNPDYCGKVSDGKGNRLLKSFAVGPDRGFQNVVVAIEGVEKGKPFIIKPLQVAVSTCRFFPFVIPVRDKRDIRIVNLDTVFHDIQAYVTQETENVDQIFNAPLPVQRSIVQQIKLSKDRRVIRMQCGMHAYMQNWGFAVENPYYDVTGRDGTFTISDLPPGTYRITAWHPLTPMKVQTVTVGPNDRATVNLEFRAEEARVMVRHNPASLGGMSGKYPLLLKPNELQSP